MDYPLRMWLQSTKINFLLEEFSQLSLNSHVMDLEHLEQTDWCPGKSTTKKIFSFTQKELLLWSLASLNTGFWNLFFFFSFFWRTVFRSKDWLVTLIWRVWWFLCLINILNCLISEALQITIELIQLLRPWKEVDLFQTETVQAVVADRTQVYSSMKNHSSSDWTNEVGEDALLFLQILIKRVRITWFLE